MTTTKYFVLSLPIMSCQPYIYRETTHHISIFFSNRGEYNVQRMSQTKAWKITIANILLLITNYRHEYVMCFEKKTIKRYSAFIL